MQFGLGNSIQVGRNPSSFFFWNVRANGTDLARGAALSLRAEMKGKEIVPGTLNAGLLHKPACAEGTQPSHLSDLVAGAGFQAKVIAKEGEIMVKHGKVLLPIAIWESSMAALSAAVTEVSNLPCDGRTLMERADDLARNAWGDLHRLFSADEFAQWGSGIAAVLWGAAQFMLKPTPTY